MAAKTKSKLKLPSNKLFAALVVVTLTIASLAVTMPLLGCNEMGDPIALFCKGCAQQVASVNQHAIKCGDADHFHCDGFTHGLAACGEHYACIAAITKYEAEIDPTKQEMNALATIKANYSKAEAELHAATDCGAEGHFKCDGAAHSEEDCNPLPQHEHTFGKATCTAPAACTVDGCNETDGEKDTSNHTGGTETKNAKAATCAAAGYTGDTYCKGCGTKTASGKEFPKLTAHAGDTEIKGKKEATCCEAGYTGDTYCQGCDTKLESGRSVAATGKHPAAVCGASGHHAHDGNAHALAPCGTKGHCTLNGGDHSPAPCQLLGHFNCDGKVDELGETAHTDDLFCLTEEEWENVVEVHVTITFPGNNWSYTIGGITVDQTSFDSLGGENPNFASKKVIFQTVIGSTFTISATDGKKVFITDPDDASVYLIKGESPVTITVDEDYLTTITESWGSYRLLYISIYHPNDVLDR